MYLVYKSDIHGCLYYSIFCLPVLGDHNTCTCILNEIIFDDECFSFVPYVLDLVNRCSNSKIC